MPMWPRPTSRTRSVSMFNVSRWDRQPNWPSSRRKSTASAPFEHRRPFFRKGAATFGGVLGGKAKRLQIPFVTDGVFTVHGIGSAQIVFGGARGDRGAAGDGPRDGVGATMKLGERRDFANQA